MQGLHLALLPATPGTPHLGTLRAAEPAARVPLQTRPPPACPRSALLACLWCNTKRHQRLVRRSQVSRFERVLTTLQFDARSRQASMPLPGALLLESHCAVHLRRQVLYACRCPVALLPGAHTVGISRITTGCEHPAVALAAWIPKLRSNPRSGLVSRPAALQQPRHLLHALRLLPQNALVPFLMC